MKTKTSSKKKTKITPASIASETNPIRLCLRCAEARTVCIAGSFNEWQPSPLQCDDAGAWSIELKLPHGDYEYLFVVDGCWLPDPACAKSRPNPFGGENSVLHVPQRRPR